MTTPAQRTPVSLLLHMCHQNQWDDPEYVLTEVQEASHDSTFTCKVTIEDVTATASGQSKKKAKHFAAKIAIEQLLSKGKSFCFDGAAVTSFTINDIILEPSSMNAPVSMDARNIIGELQEFCEKRKMLPPLYESIGESGQPHDKIFSVQCTVDYSIEWGEKKCEERFTTFGEGKSKQMAKRGAAEILYNTLVEFERINNIIPPKKKICRQPSSSSSPSEDDDEEVLSKDEDVNSNVESEIPSDDYDQSDNSDKSDDQKDMILIPDDC